MDCPTEENDIRKALAGIDGIRALRFELSARTITIDADALALEAALAVIRQASRYAALQGGGYGVSRCCHLAFRVLHL